jgi:toxin HigB-1
LQRVTL